MGIHAIPEQICNVDHGARGQIDRSGRVHTSAETFLMPIAVPTGEVLQ